MDHFGSKVSEYMTEGVTTVGAEESLGAVLRTFALRDITAAAVIDDGGRPVGVVSMTDLFRKGVGTLDAIGGAPKVSSSLHAREAMSMPPVCVDANDTVRAAAGLMVSRAIHRVFVRRHEKLVGVFSARDLMKVLRAEGSSAPLASVMSSPVATIAIGAPLEEAVERLEAQNVRGLVVTDGEVPVGIFTQREALLARALPLPLRGRPVEELMSYELLAFEQDTPLHRVAASVGALRARRVVATHHRKLAGILSSYDLARIASAS